MTVWYWRSTIPLNSEVLAVVPGTPNVGNLLREGSAPVTIVFVPGIMGSALKYRGPGPLGNIVEEYVWSEDLSDLLSENKLERLAFPSPPKANVEAVHIIETVSIYGLPMIRQEVYGTLLKHFRSVGPANGAEFIEFPYDWRASIRVSASKLVERLLGRSNRSSFVLIGHSMGGLICQVALDLSQELRNRAILRIHIATPFQGSVKAFRTLKAGPSLNTAFDRLLGSMLHLWDLGKVLSNRARLFNVLMDQIRTFPSVYELMPPEEIQALTTKTGVTFSCVNQEVWPRHLQTFVEEAKKTHAILAGCRKQCVPTLTVYSAAWRTDHTYMIRQPNASGVRAHRQVSGDGTVTGASAMHGSELDDLYLEQLEPNEHVSICKNFATLKVLEERIWGPEVLDGAPA